MLARYTMYRGQRPPGDPMPTGVRQDTRKHTSHCLRPPGDLVETFFANPTAANWKSLATGYRAAVAERFREDRAPFDAIAEQATADDVYLGCSCPTKKQPDVGRCHTVLALEFMKKKFPGLDVRMPR